MRTLRSLLFGYATLAAVSSAQTVVPPGDVSGAWNVGGSPYRVAGDITVPNGLTLTIDPGVVVEFQGHFQFNVQGRLLAIGTETDTITFTINDTTGFSNPSIPDGGWYGIRFFVTPYTNDSSKIVYCKLQYGKASSPTPPGNLGGALFVGYFNKLVVAHCLVANNWARQSGGGIALGHSSPKLTDNTISHNSASSGGGVWCSDTSSPQIVGNLIADNSADYGGGIECLGDCTPIITNTIIENNTATYNGGGIVSYFRSRPLLRNVTVRGNTASSGGGISCWRSHLAIDGSSFISNEALTGSAGAVEFGCGDTVTFTYQLNVTNSIFTDNIAAGSDGAMRASQDDSARANVGVDRCEFANNRANNYSGLRFQGGYLRFAITNSTFSGNVAVMRGAGAMFLDCRGTVSNCLFVSNDVTTEGDYYNFGSVGVVRGANVDFMNCTFADNRASYGAGLTVAAGGIATSTNCIFWGNSKDQIALDTANAQGGTLTVNHCDVQGGEDSVNITDPLSTLPWGIGNIDEDPFFVDPRISDYHLQDGSPCIGAAIDTIEIDGIPYICPPTDIEGNPRPNPPGTMPDMGACESPKGVVGAEETETVPPTEYALCQNYPNPFNPSTTILYAVPERTHVVLNVFNTLGQNVARLVDEIFDAGYHSVQFDASGLASGVYLYRLQAADFVSTKKLVIVK